MSIFPLVFLLVFINFIFKRSIEENINEYFYYLIPLIIGIWLIYRFEKKWNLDFVNNENVLLFDQHPSLKIKISNLVNELNIKQNIRFYVSDSNHINANVISNKKFAIITISKGTFKLEEEEIISLLLHEFFHVKHWTIHFINFQLTDILNNIDFRLNLFYTKRKKNIFYMYIQLMSFIDIIRFFIKTMLMMVSIFSVLFRIFIDELMADKFSIDWSKSQKIIEVIKKSDNTNVQAKKLSNNLMYSKHLDIEIRDIILKQYYYHKYIKPKWKLKKLYIYFSIFLFSLFCVYVIPKLNKILKELPQYSTAWLKKQWFLLFDNNLTLAKEVLFLIIWCTVFIFLVIRIIKLFLNGATWKLKLNSILYLMVINLFAPMALSFVILLPEDYWLINSLISITILMILNTIIKFFEKK